MQKALKILAAKAAVEKEWKKLEDKKAWVYATVRPKAEVMAEAKSKGEQCHFGSLMDLCHVKNSQLDEKEHKYKGRVVFRGDQVKDETGCFAVFSEQGTSASHTAAAKFLDAIARMPGFAGQDTDAVSAYPQAELKGPVTWISLPKHRQPANWAKIVDPVCILRLNLYGHPLAGLYWEQHCRKIILKNGFLPVRGWECLYKHPVEKLFLSVYVDDFKMAGREASLAPMWKKLGCDLDLDPPTSMDDNVYLGCSQANVKASDELVNSKNTLFHELIGSRGNLTCQESKNVVAGDSRKEGCDQKHPETTERGVGTSRVNTSQVKAYQHSMSGHAEQCVARYLELSGLKQTDLKKVSTPCIDDHLLKPEDFETKGELAAVAARIVLKILYVARICRTDLLWSVNTLAREVTKWNVACDKRLYRLICYIHSTKDYVQTSFVGDSPSQCSISMFCDASFAGDLKDSKSTSGGFIALFGPKTFVPITWICKKQGAVSHSSSEAEIISLEAVLRTEGLPALQLWEEVIEVFASPTDKKSKRGTAARSSEAKDEVVAGDSRAGGEKFLTNIDYVPTNAPDPSGKAKIVFLEDNDAVIKMVIKGRSPNMRHVTRTHRVDLDWLYERIREDPGINIRYVSTTKQIADILTKGSFTTKQWDELCRLAQVGMPGQVLTAGACNRKGKVQSGETGVSDKFVNAVCMCSCVTGSLSIASRQGLLRLLGFKYAQKSESSKERKGETGTQNISVRSHTFSKLHSRRSSNLLRLGDMPKPQSAMMKKEEPTDPPGQRPSVADIVIGDSCAANTAMTSSVVAGDSCLNSPRESLNLNFKRGEVSASNVVVGDSRRGFVMTDATQEVLEDDPWAIGTFRDPDKWYERDREVEVQGTALQALAERRKVVELTTEEWQRIYDANIDESWVDGIHQTLDSITFLTGHVHQRTLFVQRGWKSFNDLENTLYNMLNANWSETLLGCYQLRDYCNAWRNSIAFCSGQGHNRSKPYQHLGTNTKGTRKCVILSDSTLHVGSSKNNVSSYLAAWFQRNYCDYEINIHDGAEITQLYDNFHEILLKEVVAGDSCSSITPKWLQSLDWDVVVFHSFNDICQGHLTSKNQQRRVNAEKKFDEFCELLRHIRSVIVVAPGSAECWSEPNDFDTIAFPFIQKYRETGALVYSGVPLYESLEHGRKGGKINKWHFTGVHENCCKIARTIQHLIQVSWFRCNHADEPVSGNCLDARVRNRSIQVATPLTEFAVSKMHKDMLIRLRNFNDEKHQAFMQLKQELTCKETVSEEEMIELASELAEFRRPPRAADMFRARKLEKVKSEVPGYPICIEREAPRQGANLIGTIEGGQIFGPVKAVKYVAQDDDPAIYVRVPSRYEFQRDNWVLVSSKAWPSDLPVNRSA